MNATKKNIVINSNKQMSERLPTKFGVLFAGSDWGWSGLPRGMARKLALRRGINLETYDGGIDEFIGTICLHNERTSLDLIEIYHNSSQQQRDRSDLLFQPYPEELMPYVRVDIIDGYETPIVDTLREYKAMVEAYMITGDEKKLHETYQKIKEIERLAQPSYIYKINDDNNTEK
jgi:hypothetical protein